MNRKLNILIWALVFLLITNAATIGTILYHNYREAKREDQLNNTVNTGGNPINGKFFRQTLGFNNEQMEKFREINHAFRPLTFQYTITIDSLKNEMFTEMKQENPDTVKLNFQSAEIGRLHGLLKYETYKFYLDLKKICSGSQQRELEKAFQPLFINETITGQKVQPGQGRWQRIQNK
jgi:hypothetical protein